MPDSLLQQLGQDLSTRIGDGPEEDHRVTQRRRFLTSITDTRPHHRRWVLAMEALVLLVGTGLGAFWLLTDRTIPFWVEPGNINGNEGHWVNAASDAESVIRFPSGTIFTLAQGTTARVTASRQKRVILDLHDGKIHCHVHRQDDTQWLIRAGSHQIQVTGTRFTVEWVSALNRLDVRVEEGSVRVSGSVLTANEVTLRAGDHLHRSGSRIIISHDEPETRLTPTEPFNPENDSTAADETDTQQPTRVPAFRKPSRESAAAGSPIPEETRSEWRALYDQKDYAGTISVARKTGLTHLIDTLNAEDLWRLAQAARYARDGAAAGQILTGLRNRFPDNPRAGSALFLLGRVAMDIEKNSASARHWFEHYLKTIPEGPLAEEALGRLIDIHLKAGDPESARRYARIYISRYPDGSFATMAHSALH